MNKEELPIVSEPAMDHFISVCELNGMSNEAIKNFLKTIVLTAVEKAIERNRL